MLLAIDIGNTRIKWGLFDSAGNLSNTGACLHADLESASIPTAEHVMIASVANTAIQKAVAAKLAAKTVCFAKPSSTHGNLINTYANVEQLGVDRWLSAIAAWELTSSDCLIVNAGTAITVDAIKVIGKHANYLGGWITPGLHTMQKSLAQNTAQLEICHGNPSIDAKTGVLEFGLDTQTSIKNGTMAAAIGVIQLGQQALAKEQKAAVSIIISGGDGIVIADQCKQHGIAVNTDEHLVLKGLFAMHKSTNKDI